MMAPARVTKNGIPLAEVLLAKLRRQLAARNPQPGEFALSESDLARSEGVNRRFVRQAVDVLIREGKLERRPGKGLYVRNPACTSRLVQIILYDLKINMCAEIAQSAKRAGLGAGVQTQIYDAHGDFDADLEVIRNLPKSSAEGAIIVSLHHQRFLRALYELGALRYPFVLLDQVVRGLGAPSVLADNYQGGYMVGQRLTQSGHRRIGFVGLLASQTARCRLDGLRDALGNVGVAFGSGLVRIPRGQPTPEAWMCEIARVAKELLELRERPTALFISTDLLVPAVYGAIRSLGLRIPEDVSVVGFDGDPLCRLLTPTLATVRQPSHDMGALAMEMLLDLMDGRKDEGGRRKAEGNGCGDAATRGHSEASDVESGDEIPMRQEPPIGSPIAVAKGTRNQPSVWHRVLPVTWQDGESIGPAPGAAGDFTTKDTRTSDSASDPDSQPRAGEIGTGAAKSAEEIRRTDMEMVGV